MAENEAKPEAAAADAADADAEKTAETKPKSSMLPVVIIGVAMVLVSAAVTFVVVKLSVPKIQIVPENKEKVEKKGHGKVEKKGHGAEEEGKTPLMYNLDELFVNVAETKGTRILKIVPYLVLSEERLKPVLEDYKPMLRDSVSQVASRMTIDELQGLNARSNLRKEIISTLNNLLKDKLSGTVTDVYFSEFLIQ
jgi:flagellar basal body-associated protein FliL